MSTNRCAEGKAALINNEFLGTLDNNYTKLTINSSSFYLDVGGTPVFYTYIRKNACTSFKRLFRSFSSFDFRAAGGDLKGMRRFHLVSEADKASQFPYKIFIYRDPIERVVSVFKNKFIQGSGSEDIISNFVKITGINSEDATFRNFVECYVSKLSPDSGIDVHLLPQSWHLMPITYNCAISLKDIERGMASIVGADISKTYFATPINSTSHIISRDIEGAADMRVPELRKILLNDSYYPSLVSLMYEGANTSIKDLYKDDYQMLGSIMKPSLN